MTFVKTNVLINGQIKRAEKKTDFSFVTALFRPQTQSGFAKKKNNQQLHTQFICETSSVVQPTIAEIKLSFFLALSTHTRARTRSAIVRGYV